MNLASLVTTNIDDRMQPSTMARYSVQTSSYAQSRPHPTFAPSELSPYSQQLNGYPRPQPPLSPPAEEQNKCSLPSISSLLEGAGDREAKRQRPNPRDEYPARSQSFSTSSFHGQRMVLPPSPPLQPGSGSDTPSHSPGTSPLRASLSGASVSSAPATGSYHQRQTSQSSLPPPTAGRLSTSQESQTQAPYTGPAPYPSPATSTTTSYTSPIEQQSSSNLYYHRPSASGPPYQQPPSVSYTPSVSHAPHAQPPLISPGNPAWQHHHYFPPSHAAPFPQNHDRYICRTCSKAFSRPSSLRIHCHSHTGEKPFRCSHIGCGKAFSVRSNMKRHERGCHSGQPIAQGLV